MVSKNNFKNKMEQTAARTPHYGIRKLSVGVASVLISTTLYMGATSAKADTLPSTATDAATTKPEAASPSSSTQDNATADKTVETTTGVANNSTDTSVSTTPNAQASTTNTTAGATSSDKSSANNNSLVTNNVESTANTTAQTQPKTPTDKMPNGENPVVTVTYSKNAPEKVTDQKLLSQTIRYQFSNGVPAHENHVQTVLVKRTGEKDAVSGEITWGPWDDVSFKAVKSPTGIDGYKPDVKEVDAVRAVGNTDTDLTVTYHKVKDESATSETKTVSRIVEITLPDGQTKTIKQEQTLKRSKTTDLVTGDVVYGEWSKAEFDEVVAPEVDGYKPSQAKVEKETVDGNSSDQVVKITYKKVKSDVKVEAKPTVEAKHEAKVQVAPKVEAKASAKPQAKAQPKFVTTELPQTGEKQSKGTTIGAILVGLGSLLGLGALGKRKEK